MNKPVICSTPQGEIKGVEKSGYQYFLNIPFAKTHKRFAKAEPVKNWQGIYDATQKPNQPPQIVFPWVSGNTKTSEDCLYLNVYTPKSDDNKRAVMVWFYGGGLTQGSAYTNLFDGQFLAKRGNVLLVTVNYRIGQLGYSYLEHVKQDKIDTRPNIGLHDQIEALKWVQKHIESYGGDPDNVTIFGQSAGAMSVNAMLTSPATKGLFRRAISQSSGDVLISSPELSRKITDKALAKLQITPNNIEDFYEIPTKQLNTLDLHHISFDTELVPDNPLSLIKNADAHNVDLMMGYTQNEMAFPLMVKKLGYLGKLLKLFDGGRGVFGSYRTLHHMPLLSKDVKENMGEIIKFYTYYLRKESANVCEEEICEAILSDAVFAVPSRRYLDAFSQHNESTYAYRFNWGARLFHRSTPVSFHGVDIPFPFGTTRKLGKTLSMIGGINDTTHRLSTQILDSWAAFAKTGNPNTDSLPQWNRYSRENPNYMLFDINCDTTRDERNEVFEFWNGLMANDIPTTRWR